MSQPSRYRIETAACPANPGYHRWAVYRDDQPLDLPGYAYTTAWAASEAARVALHWHLVLTPLRAQPDLQDCPILGPLAADPTRAAA